MERHRATIGRRCLLLLANHGNERKCLEHKKDLVKDIMIGWELHFYHSVTVAAMEDRR